ncbi:MAG: hypothetical protein NT132_09100 [Microbacterium sp.]|uniref:DUF3618 domain-containing protein n=1 Tax=Microbacterium sp. TaxID=51671 RepID=UPI0026273AB7|nr:DUF3618 domain-containing protein [Microbacterium sp.]MCX6502542.1 hypothetical protein [Microbacterium sp.]
MSSDVPVPRTGVALGITDPVEKARAELKATLAAIEVKANVPKRASRAVEQKAAQFRHFSRQNPAAAIATAAGVAVAVGAVVWGAVRLYTR